MSAPRRPNVDWSFLPAEATPGRHGAYLVRDAGGAVLYVGHTDNLRRRLSQGHRYTGSSWFSRMDSVEFIPCDGVAEARVLEKALIATHRPAANRNDVLTPQPPRRSLPDEHVARLVELYETVVDAHLWHKSAEDDALDGYISDLRRDGWTYRAIGHGLNMTRQAIQQRLRRASARWQEARAAA